MSNSWRVFIDLLGSASNSRWIFSTGFVAWTNERAETVTAAQKKKTVLRSPQINSRPSLRVSDYDFLFYPKRCSCAIKGFVMCSRVFIYVVINLGGVRLQRSNSGRRIIVILRKPLWQMKYLRVLLKLSFIVFSILNHIYKFWFIKKK